MSYAPTMTLDQVATALEGLAPLCIRFRRAGDWYAGSDDVYLKFGSGLFGSIGNGATPEAALREYFRILVELDVGRGQQAQYIVVHAFTERRGAYRWNGQVWKRVTEALEERPIT